MGNFKFSFKSLDKLDTVDKRLAILANRAIELSPIDFGISHGLRTAEEQKELFDKGLSKCDGYKKLSKHQSGMAIDVFAIKDGKADYSAYSMDVIHGCFLQASFELKIPFVWGGNWRKFPDAPHFELK